MDQAFATNNLKQISVVAYTDAGETGLMIFLDDAFRARDSSIEICIVQTPLKISNRSEGGTCST